METLDGTYSAGEVRQSVLMYLEAFIIGFVCIRYLTMWRRMCLIQEKSLNSVYLTG
jgi:hypothetical protein